MKRSFIPSLFLLGSWFFGVPGSTPLFAHHSFTAEFDDKQPVKMSGTITKVEWANPHIWFYIDVKNADGTITNWGFSGGAPGQLMRRGITRAQLKPGSTVVIEGYRAKDGSANASGGRVTFPDGSSVLTAGAVDKVPGEK